MYEQAFPTQTTHNGQPDDGRREQATPRNELGPSKYVPIAACRADCGTDPALLAELHTLVGINSAQAHKIFEVINGNDIVFKVDGQGLCVDERGGEEEDEKCKFFHDFIFSNYF